MSFGGGDGVRTHINSEGKIIPSTSTILPKGASNTRRCNEQDSEPNTLPTELFRPQTWIRFSLLPWVFFSGSSHTSDLIIGTTVSVLPGAWHCVVSAGTGRPGVSTRRLDETESLICNCFNVTAVITD